MATPLNQLTRDQLIRMYQELLGYVGEEAHRGHMPAFLAIDRCDAIAAEPPEGGPGVYRHFKGGLYRLVTTGKLESDGTDVIVYTHLGDDDPTTWVRPVSSWIQWVPWPDGETKPRFMPEVAGPAA